jgi:hypothetical protein
MTDVAHFTDAVTRFPNALVFAVEDQESGTPEDWLLRPMPNLTVPSGEGFYILRAKHVLGKGHARDCYVDASLRERIIDYAYFPSGSSAGHSYFSEYCGKVVPAVAIEEVGEYEQYYSRADPEVGISVLREGLHVARQRAPIALDLGYIFRDEHRYQEAIDAFTIVIEEGPSCCRVFLDERADLLDRIGEHAKAKADRDRLLVFKQQQPNVP